jgi:hypothetical protein
MKFIWLSIILLIKNLFSHLLPLFLPHINRIASIALANHAAVACQRSSSLRLRNLTQAGFAGCRKWFHALSTAAISLSEIILLFSISCCLWRWIRTAHIVLFFVVIPGFLFLVNCILWMLRVCYNLSITLTLRFIFLVFLLIIFLVCVFIRKILTVIKLLLFLIFIFVLVSVGRIGHIPTIFWAPSLLVASLTSWIAFILFGFVNILFLYFVDYKIYFV